MGATEHQEQVALMTWAMLLEKEYPALRNLFAIPNGGKRHIGTARKLKAEGVKPGVPDLFLAVPSLGYHGLFIEMKRQKGGHTSDAQTERIGNLLAEGYSVVVCHGWIEAKETILNYLGGKDA